MKFHDGYSIRAALSPLTSSEIVEAALPDVLVFEARNSREDLYGMVRDLTLPAQMRIRAAAFTKATQGEW